MTRSNKPYYKSPKIEIRRSKISGVGVFANADIMAGEILEECPYIVIESAWKHIPDTLKDYIFYNGRKYKWNESVIVFGYGSIFNHSENGKAKWYIDKKRKKFKFIALEDIKAQDEILVHYGEEYWKNRDYKPKQ